jgi:hypothetical protein
MAIRTVGRAIGSFHPAAMPALARIHYRRELVAWLFLPVMMGAIEGGVVGVIAKNAFASTVPEWWLNLAVAVLTGAPAFANVTSFLWTTVSHGRHKIRFLVGLQIAAAALIAQVALAPSGPVGLVMLLLAAVGARVCWAGVVTLRSTVWRANYPAHVRALMAGKLATVQALVLAGGGLAIALAMRHDPNAFHVLYPIAAGLGLVGAVVYGRMRVRGHAALLNDERRIADDHAAAFQPARLLDILRSDRLFRRYMACMFVFGTGNIAMTAPLVIMLRDVFGYEYLAGILITTCIPIVIMPAVIPLWARLLDRTHILRFRAVHAWAFVSANVVVLVAALTLTPSLLWVAAALKGVALGGGVLGWNLGHHDFAPIERASDYMGIHVTLTGVRGLIAPLAAVAVYQMLERAQPGAGPWVFALCLALTLVGTTGFTIMRRWVPPGARSQG